MENLLLNFDYPILSHLNIPYQFQIEDEFSYSIAQYNELHKDDDPKPPEYQAMRTVLYKLKYPDYANMIYETVQGNTYLTLFLTPSDRSDGYIGFHDGSQILLQSKTIDYPVNVDDIAVPQPSINPNTVVFDPIAITPDFTQSLSKRSRDTVFNPPMYSVDIKTQMNIAREITVTPSSFPYYFSIDDYNQSNNTEFIGVRRLAVNGSSSGKIIVNKIRVYDGISSLFDVTTTNGSSSFNMPINAAIVFAFCYSVNGGYKFSYFGLNNNSSSAISVQINFPYGVSARLFSYCFETGNYNDSFMGFQLLTGNNNVIFTMSNFNKYGISSSVNVSPSFSDGFFRLGASYRMAYTIVNNNSEIEYNL